MNRKPTYVLQLNGAFRKNPQRRRSDPIANGPLGSPPERLPAECHVFWNEIVSQAAKWLTGSDRWAVELAARLMQKAVRQPDHAAILDLARSAGLSPVETRALLRAQEISGSELATLRSLLGALGLTPTDRSKLSVNPEKPINRFTELATERPN